MISFRKLWESDPQNAGDLRVVQLLLQGIALHAIEGDPEDHARFRSDMKALLDQVDDKASAAMLLMATGAALKTLEDYNQRTGRWVKVQSTELQNMIAMLTKAILTLGFASDRSVTRLREIGDQIEKTVQIDDVRVLKARMEACLEGIRDETSRQRTEAAHTLEGLKHEVSQTQDRIRTVATAPTLDPVTGLLTRADALVAFEEATSASHPAYVALFVVDRVSAINGRFGYAVGDRVLKLYLDELRKVLPATDRIYRWNGPAFVVLMVHPQRLEQVSEQLRFLVPGKLEKTVELTNRSVLLPISATWTVFPVLLPIEALTERLDQFLAHQWQQKDS